eukprot:312943-Pyramimonas_sp.AAC.1
MESIAQTDSRFASTPTSGGNPLSQAREHHHSTDSAEYRFSVFWPVWNSRTGEPAPTTIALT